MQIETIKQKLKNGDLRFISETTGFSKEYVQKVLSGERNNELIVKAAEQVALSNDSLKEQIEIMVNG